jgi:hypothetical protein
MPRYCVYCGAELHTVTPRFCPVCGKPIQSQASVPPPQDMYLLSQIPGQAPYEIQLALAVMTLGRAPDNQIILQLPYVSLHHGRFVFEGIQWTYADLGSTNGTFVNGVKTQHAVLHHGDSVLVETKQQSTTLASWLLVRLKWI